MCDPSLARATTEHFRDEFLVIKRCTNLQLLYFTSLSLRKSVALTPLVHDRKGNEPTIMILYTVKELKAILNHSINCYRWLSPPCPQRAPSAFQF